MSGTCNKFCQCYEMQQVALPFNQHKNAAATSDSILHLVVADDVTCGWFPVLSGNVTGNANAVRVPNAPDFQRETPSLHLGSGPRSADLRNMNQKFLVATSAGAECHSQAAAAAACSLFKP